MDGFRSPPHIHNVSYRGVVISGLVHNDDPKAADMWMTAGSFWTQPKGGVHITAAKGRHNLAYIEIDDGPYLVRPVDKAFGSGEKPINVDASNIVWIDRPGIPASANGPKVAYLWGNPQSGRPYGTFLKLPAGSAVKIQGGSTLRAVMIQGRTKYRAPSATNAQTLEPGSYFGSTGKAAHQLACDATGDCILYLRAEGRFDVDPVQPDR